MEFDVKSGTGWKVSVFGVFLVRIFPHTDWIWRENPYLSVFSPNAGQCGKEQLRLQTLFTRCEVYITKICNEIFDWMHSIFITCPSLSLFLSCSYFRERFFKKNKLLHLSFKVLNIQKRRFYIYHFKNKTKVKG